MCASHVVCYHLEPLAQRIGEDVRQRVDVAKDDVIRERKQVEIRNNSHFAVCPIRNGLCGQDRVAAGCVVEDDEDEQLPSGRGLAGDNFT